MTYKVTTVGPPHITRDGDGYSPDLPSVTWKQLFGKIDLRRKEFRNNNFIITAIGKMYTSHNAILGKALVLGLQEFKELRARVKRSKGLTFEQQVQDIFSLPEPPQHIVSWKISTVAE